MRKKIPAAPVLPKHSGHGKLYAVKDQIMTEMKVIAMSLSNK